MNPRVSVLAAALLASACGKGTKDQNPTIESRVPEGPASAPASPAKAPAQAPAKAAARGPERVAYSLIDNRLAAHVTRNDGLVIPAGSAAFAKYVRFANQIAKKDAHKPWELRETIGDTKVAKLSGKTGAIFVPLTAAQAKRNSIRLRIHAKAETLISVRVNDNKDLNGKLAEGWSTHEIAVPAGQLKEGENAIQIYVKEPGVALATVEVGTTATVGEQPIALYDPAAKALVIPKGGKLAWHVLVPEKARLTADLADGACQLAVTATAEDGATAEGKLVGLGSAVELGTLAGKAARLELEAAGCATAAVANAAVVVPGEALAVKRGEPPKYVLFIIMDSLRADRVRAFNPKARPETPSFEKLAESSTLFMQHYVQGNESQVSHASMWTSMYLAKHKAAQMADKIPERYTTIDEVAKKAGKYIVGVSANGYIRPARGFGKSWDKFANHIEQGGGLKGADVMDKGLGWIEPKKDRPWFLYLGMIDTHVTWRAKQPWLDKYDGGYKGRFASEFGDDGPNGFAKDLTDQEKDHVRALYDSNVSYQDDLLGKLIAKLQAWGVWDQTMLVITADHGDEQWEDGRVGHGGSQKEALIHVPLVIHYPPLFPAAKVTTGTEGIDVLPTIADALGVELDPEWQGTSLIGVANGQMVYPLLATSSQYENFHGARLGSWKLRLAGTGAPQLFNLGKDRGERTDLWGEPNTGIASRMLLDPMWLFRTWNVEWKKAQWGNPASVTSRFASDLGE